MKIHWTGSVAPGIIEKLILPASLHPNTNYTGSSKQWLLAIPHNKRTRRRSTTAKRPISRNLNEEPEQYRCTHRQPYTAASQGTDRPGRESSFTLVSIFYALPWSPLMALVKQERPNSDRTQHGSSQMFLHHKSLVTQPCIPTNLWFFHCYFQLYVPELVGSAWYMIPC